MTLSLPLINLSSYFEPSKFTDNDREVASMVLHDACRFYGFFYLRLDGFATEEEMAELTELGREFFHLEQEKKDEIRLANEDGARGYQRLKENITMGKADNHEGIDFYKPVPEPDKSRPLWGTNQWPKHVPGFRAKFEAWISKMQILGIIVMEAMAKGLGMTPDEWIALRSQVDNSFWVMRIIGYPPLPPNHDGFSCGAHRDYGCITFLYADPTIAALQVFLDSDIPAARQVVDASLALPPEQGDAGGVWINADPLRGAIVCNIGEMWETWTAGLYKSTLHRVIHRSSNYRVSYVQTFLHAPNLFPPYLISTSCDLLTTNVDARPSVPFFFEPNFTALVKPLPAALRILEREMAENGQEGVNAQKAYQPVVYGDFLKGKVGGNFAEESNTRERY